MTLLKGKGVPELNRHTVQKVDNRPVEITVVKKVDDFVLLMRNVAIETEVMENNAVWRFKTYEAFKDKAINISDEYADYALPVDKPVITPFLNNDSLCPQVVVTFITTLPGRKVVH